MPSQPNPTEASIEVSSLSLSQPLQTLRAFKQKNQALVNCIKIIVEALVFVIPGYLMAGDQKSLPNVFLTS
jgi:hypothetical protein